MTGMSTGGSVESAPADAGKRTMTWRGAVLIGIGSMVGAGIFALFGEAGAIAGAAVWVSFLVGGIAMLSQTLGELWFLVPRARGLLSITSILGPAAPGTGSPASELEGRSV